MTALLRKPVIAAALVAAVALIAPAAGLAQTAGDPVPTWSPAELAFGKTKVRKSSEIGRVFVDPHTGCGEGWAPPTPCYLLYGFLDIAVSGPFEIEDSTTCRRFGEQPRPCFVDVRFRPLSRGRHDGFLRITRGTPAKPENARGVSLNGKGCHQVKVKTKKGKKKKLRCKPKK